MASVSIKDAFYLKFFIEDKEIEGMDTAFDNISVIESLSQSAPTMKLSVYDRAGYLSRNQSLVEGTKFTIDIGKSINKRYKGDFRLFGMENHESQFGGQLWDLTFIFNVPKYTTKSCCEVYANGSSPIHSAQAMQMIAGKCGLKYEGVGSANDYQRWLNIAQTRSAMAEYIAAHGYLSDKSCMVHGVTGTNKLLYKDIIAESVKSPKAHFLHNSPERIAEATPYSVREAKSITTSGIVNSWFNYGQKMTNHSLAGESTIDESMAAVKTGPYLPINADVKSEIEKSRIDYARYLDCGSDSPNEVENNVHLNFNKAYYQNMRYRSLFCERVHVLVEEKTDLQILDPVKYTQHDLIAEKYEINPRTTGKYVVTAKTIHGKAGSAYYEKFELMRAHVTNPGLTKLL